MSREKEPLGTLGYLWRIPCAYAGGNLQDYMRLAPNINIFGRSLGTRYMAWRQEGKRRFPEYRLPHTLSLLDTAYQGITNESSARHPHALDAGSAFIALVFALDDAFDNNQPPAEKFSRPTDLLNHSLEEIQLPHAEHPHHRTGHQILNDICAVIALDYPAQNRTHVLESITSYLVDCFQVFIDIKERTHPWTFEDALEMRKQVSGKLGFVIGEIFSSAESRETGSDKTSDEKNLLPILAMVGQFHDDLWDLVEENKDQTHNLFILLAQENHPDEKRAVCRYLTQIKNGGQTPHPHIRKTIREQLRQFVPFYNIVAQVPDLAPNNLIIPEKANPIQRARGIKKSP